MTITLQCEHCNQTMAIAPRKPGSQVTCPACGRGVVVPGAHGSRPAAMGAINAVPAALGTKTAVHSGAAAAPAERTKEPAIAALPARPTASPPTAKNRSHETAWSPRADSPVAADPFSADRTAVPKGVLTVPVSVVILCLVFALGSLVMAFAAGYLFGRHG
jgi:ribosomal protein S27E